MATFHGNVQGRPAIAHPAYPRYVAVIDVLGMKEWLKRDTAQFIAEQLDRALVACGQSSTGLTNEGHHYGPLISTTHFSDTLLAWSPDDSWASFATICSSVKLIVAVALLNGVPLRGAISCGEAVCNSRTFRFVGTPIAKAYLWAERGRKYRSVGVDIEPETLTWLRDKLDSDPMPNCWDCELSGVPSAVIRRTSESSQSLLWHDDCLFLNHWAHGIFTGNDPRQLFLQRDLPLTEEDAKRVTQKIDQMMEFFAASKARMRDIVFKLAKSNRLSPETAFETTRAQSQEYLALDQVRLARFPS